MLKCTGTLHITMEKDASRIVQGVQKKKRLQSTHPYDLEMYCWKKYHIIHGKWHVLCFNSEETSVRMIYPQPLHAVIQNPTPEPMVTLMPSGRRYRILNLPPYLIVFCLHLNHLEGSAGGFTILFEHVTP